MAKLFRHCLLLILHALQWKTGSLCQFATWDVKGDNTIIFSLSLNTDTNKIVFNITTSVTDGYVALGLSLDNLMAATDVYMVEIQQGTVNVTDRYATTKTLPPIDQQQDITVTYNTLDGSTLEVIFERARSTMDMADITLEENTNFFLLHAEGPISNDNPTFHSSRSASPMTYIAVCISVTTTETFITTTEDDNTEANSTANAIGTFGRSVYSWAFLMRIINVILIVYVTSACFR